MTVNERALAWCREELQRAEEWATERVKHGSDDDLKEAVNAVEETGAMVDALERQIPARPEPAFEGTGISWCGVCPRCGRICLSDRLYCSTCGQRLDWPKEDDG